MLVALVGALGDAPAQVEKSTRLDDVEHAAERRRDQRSVEMHDHGFAQEIVVGVGGNAAQLGQLCKRELKIGISRACLGKESARSVKTLRRKTIRVQPRHLSPAAATDIGCCSTLDKEAPD